jgi:hypothetical protein
VHSREYRLSLHHSSLLNTVEGEKTRVVLTFCFVATLAPILYAVAPNEPQGLAAAVNGTTVTLTWIPPSTGGVPTGYVVVDGAGQSGVAALIRRFETIQTRRLEADG